MKNAATQDAAATFKSLLARAARDEQLMKNLKELEAALIGVDDAPDDYGCASSGRSKLPYSSDPPVCDNAWK